MTVGEFIDRQLVTPVIQRRVDSSHVTRIVEYQIKQFKKYGEVDHGNAFVIGELNDTHYLLDGQHRYCALKLLVENYDDSIRNKPIVYMLKKVTTLTQLQEIFLSLARNAPIDEWHIDILEQKDDDALRRKQLVESVTDLFVTSFPGIVKKTSRPIRPHISTEYLAELILEINQMGLSTTSEIHDALIEMNSEYQEMFRVTYSKKLPSTGMVSKFIDKRCYISLRTLDIGAKVKIPKHVRVRVWDRYFPNHSQGKCAQCSGHITVHHFEAGHIVSEVNGGLVTIDNLIPMCGMCNRSLGARDLSKSFTHE